MTTEQMIEPAQRPLNQVDEVAEWIQSSPGTAEPDDFAMATPQRAVQRATEDPRLVAVLVIGLVSVILLAALAWGRRPPPRSAEIVLLERSREAVDRSRDALEAAVARLVGSALER
jgi:hypothetical protein